MAGGRQVMNWVVLGATIALVLLIMAIIFGNLSGNVGFSTGTQGYNDTQDIIQNYTLSATNTSSQLPTVGTIVGIALLLLVLIGILVFALTKLNRLGGSNKNFA